MIHFHLITIFPEMFDSYIAESILARAITNKKIKISFYNPRDFTKDKHRRVDDKPYGGGPGMVMQAEPILRAVAKARGRKKQAPVFIMSPRGKEFTNGIAARWGSRYSDIILISGRYEGIDARVKKALNAREISIGPYTMTGGEIPAMVIIDAVARHIPGVLGDRESLEEKRTTEGETYTRPEAFVYKGKTYRVPKVLRSGHHADIEKWRGRKHKKEIGGETPKFPHSLDE